MAAALMPSLERAEGLSSPTSKQIWTCPPETEGSYCQLKKEAHCQLCKSVYNAASNFFPFQPAGMSDAIHSLCMPLSNFGLLCLREFELWRASSIICWLCLRVQCCCILVSNLGLEWCNMKLFISVALLSKLFVDTEGPVLQGCCWDWLHSCAVAVEYFEGFSAVTFLTPPHLRLLAYKDIKSWKYSLSCSSVALSLVKAQ